MFKAPIIALLFIRIMDVGIQRIQGIQCSVNASVHTDPGNTGQGILGLWTWEYKEYREYSVTLA